VKVHTSVHRKEIILDINMDYAGDSEISVALGVMPPVSKVIEPKGGLQHITIKSNVRLHLAPLLRDSPFVGSVSLSFLDIPEIDFVLNGFIKVLDFPGIEVLLKKFISNYLEQHFVNPNSLKIPIQPQPNTPIALTSQRRLEEGGTHSLATPKGVLRINVLEAKGLQNKDLNLIGSSNKSDPYATLEVQVDSQHHSFKTHVIPNNLHPHWNFTAELIVDDTESLDQILLQIWDKDSSNKDDFLGKCELPLSGIKSAIESGEPYDSWTILEKVQRGSLRTILSWSSLCSNTQLSDKSEDAPGSVGVLVIEIDSCSNLLGGRMTGLKLPNPKVVVELGGISQETEVVAGSIHPVFEHRMSFLVSNPKVDSLKISVMDTRKSLKKPTIFGTLRLNLSGFLGREDLSLLNQQFNLKSDPLGLKR
ncbi:Extended synaptotagmin2like, partial [Caligus rogercresseyi]